MTSANPGLRTAGYVLLGVGAYGLFAGLSNAFACPLPGGGASCSNDTSGYAISHVAPSAGGLAFTF